MTAEVRDGFSIRAAYWVWRRELQITLRAPILYVIGGLFLVVQGIAFAGLVNALSDPRRPAPLGALLEGQLAGTLLTWVLQLVVLTLLGMRAIAEERRSGGWELLLTAQVSERAAVIGKWLAATTLYALLWVPTLAYLAVVAVFRSDGGGWDLASIATGYVGAIAVGSALLAWTIAASAATTSTLAAGALGFLALIAMFLAGELGTLSPELVTDHPTVAAALDAISLRGHLAALARGEVSLAALGLLAGIAIVGLSVAVVLACAGRRSRRELRTRTAATVLLAAACVLGNVLIVRHPVRWDATGKNGLDPRTREVLAELPGPARLAIVQPTLGALEPIYDEVARVAARMAEEAPIVVTRVDPATIPGGLPAAAREAGIPEAKLQSHGAVVVEVGGHRRVVDRVALASLDRAPDGSIVVENLAIEQAIAGAFAELELGKPIAVCATTGHGELSLVTPGKDGADWTSVGNRLRADGIAVDDIAIASPTDVGRPAPPEAVRSTIEGGVPARCNAVVVAGPTTPLSPAEALAVQDFVARGGGLVVAAATRPVPGAQLASTGLEGVLAADGLGLPFAVAVDPTLAIREIPGALFVVDGYTDHPINAGFAGSRATLWFQPRPVIASGGAKPLVSATAASWGERDLDHSPAKDADDLAGPVVLAAIGAKHPVVAMGSAESMMGPMFVGGASATDLWMVGAIRHVAGVPAPKLAIAARRPDQVRLVMTAGERRTVIGLSIAGIPLLWCVAGAALLLLRRRAT